MRLRRLAVTVTAAATVAVAAVLTYDAVTQTGPDQWGWQWEGEGREEARQDIANNTLRLRWSGCPGPDTFDIHDAWRKQLGVEPVAAALMNEKTIGTTRGYNAEMRAEIDRRFGPNALERVAGQLKDERAKANPPKPVAD